MHRRLVMAAAAAVLALSALAAPAHASWWPFDDGGHRHHDGKVYPGYPVAGVPPWGPPPGWMQGPRRPAPPPPGYGRQHAPVPPMYRWVPPSRPGPGPAPWMWAPPQRW